MQDFKYNKKLYIVVRDNGEHTPVKFDGGRFLIGLHDKKNPLSVYTKKVAKKLIEADAITCRNEGYEPKEYLLFPLDLPYHYMRRLLTGKEASAKKEAKTKVTGAQLDWYSSNLDVLTRPLGTPIGVPAEEKNILSPEKAAQ